jgi:hypothetical protein
LREKVVFDLGKGIQNPGSALVEYASNAVQYFGNGAAQNLKYAFSNCREKVIFDLGEGIQNPGSAFVEYASNVVQYLGNCVVKHLPNLNLGNGATQNLKSAFSNCWKKVVFDPGEDISVAATAKHWYDCIVKHLPNLGTNAINALKENAIKLKSI